MTMLTRAPPSVMVPPLPKPMVSTPSLPPHISAISWMQAMGMPLSREIASAPEAWSPCPCVSRIWVAPSKASASRPSGNTGLPTNQGSISSTASSISIRKPEWPSQMIFIWYPPYAVYL